MIRLIVFDLDGTLVDSKQDLADAVNHLIVDLGGTPLPSDDVAAMVGEGVHVLVGRALAAASLDPSTTDAVERFLSHYGEGLLRHTLPYPGMMDALRTLAGDVPLAVLTNKPSPATMQVLDGLGLLPLFSEVIGGDTAFGRKPDPAGLLELISRAATTPAATLLVGDSPIDMETARNAGTRLCVARYGFGYRTSIDLRQQDLAIDAPSELSHLLSELPRRT